MTSRTYNLGNVKGAKGDTGAAAGFGTPTATATTLEPGSSATASVTASGADTSKVFAFTFGIPKGAKGDTGTAAGFGTPAASAATLEAGSSAMASVVASGEDTAKVFTFAFGIPKGDKGDTGATGDTGVKGDKGDTGDDGVSPTLSASKSGGTTTIKYTDASHPTETTLATIDDGDDGGAYYLNDVSIATSAWVLDSSAPYSGYSYKATITDPDITATMIPWVIFSPNDANNGNFCPVAVTDAGHCYLYARVAPTATVTIPTIMLQPTRGEL